MHDWYADWQAGKAELQNAQDETGLTGITCGNRHLVELETTWNGRRAYLELNHSGEAWVLVNLYQRR